jgi:hypothetical protein
VGGRESRTRAREAGEEVMDKTFAGEEVVGGRERAGKTRAREAGEEVVGGRKRAGLEPAKRARR